MLAEQGIPQSVLEEGLSVTAPGGPQVWSRWRAHHVATGSGNAKAGNWRDVGEGMPSIPQKLAAKMLCWEYVEMGELFPEFLARRRDDKEGKDRAAKQGWKVTDY